MLPLVSSYKNQAPLFGHQYASGHPCEYLFKDTSTNEQVVSLILDPGSPLTHQVSRAEVSASLTSGECARFPSRNERRRGIGLLGGINPVYGSVGNICRMTRQACNIRL